MSNTQPATTTAKAPAAATPNGQDTVCFLFMGEANQLFSPRDARKKPPSMKSSKGSLDKNTPVIWVSDLTAEEGEKIKSMDVITRHNIYSDLSQFLAWKNPRSGYGLCERVAECVRRITQKKTIEETLCIPTISIGKQKGFVNCNDRNTQHPHRDFVRKIYEPLMESINEKNKTQKRFYGGCRRLYMPTFQTFWRDYFLLYRSFIETIATSAECTIRRALHYGKEMNHRYDLQANQMRQIIQDYKSGAIRQKPDEYFSDSEDNMSSWEGMEKRHTKRKRAQRKRDREAEGQSQLSPSQPQETLGSVQNEEEEYDDGARLPSLLFQLASQISAKLKNDNRKARRMTRPTRSPKKQRIPSQHASPTVATDAAVYKGNALPLFTPQQVDLPEDEWLILEIPYPGIVRSELCRGLSYVPPGSSDSVMVVQAIHVKKAFAYTMNNAHLLHHGQVTDTEKQLIAKNCAEQPISMMNVFPRNKIWRSNDVNVLGDESDLYQKCFAGLRLDIQALYHYLKENVKTRDAERGTIQKTIGVSTQNYESHAKEGEEADQILDAPSWSGTPRDFEHFVPLLGDLPDRIQDMVDHLFDRTLFSDCTRQAMFANKLREMLGLSRFQFETFTVSMSLLDPRTDTLTRHLDEHNDDRPGYTTTAIWSCLFEVPDGDKLVKGRLSFIAYTRAQAGNFIDKSHTYIAVWRNKIRRVQQPDMYPLANQYVNLNLSSLSFSHEQVWGKGPNVTLECAIIPGYFDPSAYLSAFAWVINLLSKKWQLERKQILELVYIASVVSSCLPFVWLLKEWLKEDKQDLAQALAESTCFSHFYYTQMIVRTGRQNPLGGRIPRHQTCVQDWPGGIGVTDATFTEDSFSKHDKHLSNLSSIIDDFCSQQLRMDGAQTREVIKKMDSVGELCVLKVLPLAAMVGLYDVSEVFNVALYGEAPSDKPHTKLLVKMGCQLKTQQQKFMEGINQWLGIPREWFFHSDHVLCFTESVLSGSTKQEVFFPDMTLYRFKENKENRTIELVQKSFGETAWVPTRPRATTPSPQKN